MDTKENHGAYSCWVVKYMHCNILTEVEYDNAVLSADRLYAAGKVNKGQYFEMIRFANETLDKFKEAP